MTWNKAIVAVIAASAAAYLAGRAGVGAAAPAAATQPEGDMMMAPPGPGAHHTHLDHLVGSFEGVFKYRPMPDMPMMEMPSTVEREKILGGRFLLEKVKSESPMGSFEGYGLLGYNDTRGCYELVWVDNMTNAMMHESGTFDGASKTFRMQGSHFDPMMGGTVFTRGAMDLSDPNRHVASGHAIGPDGREFKLYEGVFERVD